MANTDPNCIFCKIIAGQIPSNKILETEKTFAFLDINPLSKGHALIIPKYHCEKLHELPPAEMAEIGPNIVKVAKAIGASDYNLLQNNGALAHQEVKHVHFHIIPKPNAEEGLGVGWPTKSADKDELKETLERVKGSL
eukprot:CAMPEP_0201489614 /NCGR_PEP_ID=MMETSP0151_2-20130828/22964_1 /ASSEMBLY_ACC=CAM_ASM_000257 /TAXON_ID=200890 /ORGANISM="Paramoeba atlantica, Strain 621/1 / CCAP 1560/9" /LENGTH=137 /DNA_ID=CAMNT_0047875259 /DNA_START=53 /DNA_END=466 /DNA_ORIENTATION=+